MRRRDFRLFWFGGAVNLLGSHATALVLPVLVLTVDGSPLAAGAVGTVGATLEVAAAPIAGVYADRGSRRTLMAGSLLVAAAASGTIAAAIGLRDASLPLLFGCAAAGGVATAVYTAAASGSIRALLPERDPERALGGLQAREQGARLAGPGVGGGLFQLAAWAPFLVDAASYLVAAGCARAIRAGLRPVTAPAERTEPEGCDAAGFRREFAAGLGFLWRAPFLRFVTLWAGGVNLLVGVLWFEVVLLARTHGAPAGEIGLVLTVAGAAGLAGALLSPLVLARVRAGTLVLAASWAMAAVTVPFVAARSVWVGGAVLAAVSLMAPALSIVFQSKAIMLTPDHMQGRVGSALGTLGEGTAAVSPLLAGVLVDGVRPWVAPLPAVAGLVLLAGYTTANASRLHEPAPSGAVDLAPDGAAEPVPIPSPRSHEGMT